MKILIPSKTFLWGEYSAIQGGPAGILSHGPYFEALIKPKLNDSKNKSSGVEFKENKESTHIKDSDSDLFSPDSHSSVFHPDSPAGNLLKSAKNKLVYQSLISFKDPYQLAGGFGRSTAEWIAAKLASDYADVIPRVESININSLWTQYRSLFKSHQNVPSGYDLACQLSCSIISENSFGPEAINDILSIPTTDKKENIHEKYRASGTVSLVHVEDQSLKISSSKKLFSGLNILVFKTKHKIKTHEHLESLKPQDFGSLTGLSQKVSQAYLNKDIQIFFKSLELFDIELKELNCKNPTSVEMTNRILKIEGVSYARGCGALGADVIAVFYDGVSFRELSSEIEKSEDLIFIANIKGID